MGERAKLVVELSILPEDILKDGVTDKEIDECQFRWQALLKSNGTTFYGGSEPVNGVYSAHRGEGISLGRALLDLAYGVIKSEGAGRYFSPVHGFVDENQRIVAFMCTVGKTEDGEIDMGVKTAVVNMGSLEEELNRIEAAYTGDPYFRWMGDGRPTVESLSTIGGKLGGKW